MKATYKEFIQDLPSFRDNSQDVLDEAAEFASTLEREQIISISTYGGGMGISTRVIVWYWEE